ncbi:Golgin subfamily A member 7/ERF4 family-domain-containing protein [Cantharellus anzutake]|uniref:Golgin subfamily A member 7/ERF4 family-domain-containing protein n=1 Tax=Cantharellus anzutake TaxID=1750568 RepID=UPI001906F30B|nr:Golgin subfamily A member 7/ERF4 family-domain-containing protein [Cantharellus anzutake]KAF8330390.1 Golgin subfamily A member 7/ERF4 family-domain-containing protein [Cantharellus anzutake]
MDGDANGGEGESERSHRGHQDSPKDTRSRRLSTSSPSSHPQPSSNPTTPPISPVKTEEKHVRISAEDEEDKELEERREVETSRHSLELDSSPQRTKSARRHGLLGQTALNEMVFANPSTSPHRHARPSDGDGEGEEEDRDGDYGDYVVVTSLDVVSEKEMRRTAMAKRKIEFGTDPNAGGRTMGDQSEVQHEEIRPPKSSYYIGPPGVDSAYGTPPIGQIGIHYPREIFRIERDYTAGELPQFLPTYPLELEGRITPTQFQETINDINEILISAYSTQAAFWENLLAVATLYTSMLFIKTHYNKEMRRLKMLIDEKNAIMYHPQGLHIVWPRKSAFLFVSVVPILMVLQY